MGHDEEDVEDTGVAVAAIPPELSADEGSKKKRKKKKGKKVC